jgi:hypothetical protein
MRRYWIKLMLLVLLVLIQTACPKYVTQQTNEDVRRHPPEDHSGGGG